MGEAAVLAQSVYASDILPLDDIFVLDETFDELTNAVAEKPDDVVAFDALRAHIAAVQESGQVDRVMSMSMVLGAMACLHPHLEDVANETARLNDKEDNEEKVVKHNASGCYACKAGKYCSRKTRQNRR